MARILCVTAGLPGLVYSSIELARRLAAAGHRVVHAGPPEDRGLVEQNGLELLPLEPSGYERFLEVDARTGTLQRLLTLRDRRDRALRSLAVRGFARAVRELQPDLALINGEMHEHVLAAASTGVPMALLNTFVSIWRRPGLPPPHHLARPGVGWQGSRPGTALLWLTLRLGKWRRVWSQRLRRLGCDRLAVLRLLARETGFDLRRETDAGQWLIPFTYRRLPVLTLHALEFELPHRPPENVHYVGPMILEARDDRPLAAEDRLRLATIFARCRRAGGDRTLIYAGFGSVFSTDPGLLRRLLRVVTERPDWELVIGLTGPVAPGSLGELPERVHAFPWLPQLEVLRHADAAIIHGGVNTVDECVVAAVPMLVYCGGETDMAGTTARVVHHGIGIAGDRRDGAVEGRAHLDRLLHEPGFRQRLTRLRARYLAYRERRVAERTVEALLGHAEGAGASPAGDGACR